MVLHFGKQIIFFLTLCCCFLSIPTVAGVFDGSASALPDIRQVVEGQPFRLRCPEHSYMRGCVYKWGGNSHAGGMKFVGKDRNRVVLPNGTLFFSAITKTDITDFGWENGGWECILDCVFPGAHSMTSSHKVSLNKTGSKQPFIPVFKEISIIIISKLYRINSKTRAKHKLNLTFRGILERKLNVAQLVRIT